MRLIVVLTMFSLVCADAEQQFRCGTTKKNGTHVKWKTSVSTCKDCEESLCKISDELPLTWYLQSDVCYWSDYRELCFSGKGLMLPL